MTATTALTPEQLQRGLRRSRQRTARRWALLGNTPGRALSCLILAVFALLAIVGPYLYPANLPINPKNIYARRAWRTCSARTSRAPPPSP